MNVTLIRFTPEPDKLCGEAAAICTGYTGDPLKAMRGALDSGHESVAEHASFTFRVEGVSRVLLAQLTRHRVASYSVQSQRYCGANLDIVVPDSMACPELVDEIVEVRRAVEKLYDKAISLGKPAEDARYFTLQAGVTSLIVTMAGSEEIYDPWTIRIELTLIPNEGSKTSRALTWQDVEDALDFGQLMGIGQFYNGGYGRFTWKRVDGEA